MERFFPYSEQILKLTLLDIIERHGGQGEALADSRSIVSDLLLFDRVSRIQFDIQPLAVGNQLRFQMLIPAPDLTERGQGRALNYLADSIEQLMENSFQVP